MKTQPNENNFQNIPNKGILFNDEFIGYINILNDSIKEFYKVSQNTNKNKNILIDLGVNELNNAKILLNEIYKDEVNNNKINAITIIVEQLRDIFLKFHINVLSEKSNIINFFEDAKVLFKEMKEKHRELILRVKKRANSASKTKFLGISTSSQNNDSINLKKSDIGDIKKFSPSEITYDNKNINNTLSSFEYNIKGNKSARHKEVNFINNSRSRKSKTLTKSKESLNDENMNTVDDVCCSEPKNENKISDIFKKGTKSQIIEIQKLKLMNKQLSNELKKCKSKILEKDNNFLNISKKNESDILEKDKIILSLKEENIKNNKKYNVLMKNLSNFKNEIDKLKEENNNLKKINILIKKSNDLNSYTNNKVPDKNLALKLNNLVKENMMLKNNIDELKLKSLSQKSEYNIQPNINDKNENEILKNKLNIAENELINMKKQNKELNNKINLLRKNHETEISKLSKNNSELLSNLENKRNDLSRFKKEFINKNKEIETLKHSLINLKNLNNINPINIGNSEKIEKENEKLKATNNVLQDKIKYYQTQLRKIKNEILNKNQAIIESENLNLIKIKDIKQDYEKKISEITSKNKTLENAIEKYKISDNDLNQQISNLNLQIVSKDVKIQELYVQIEQIQKAIEDKEEENKELLNAAKTNNYKKEDIQKLNEKIEEQENLIKDLNEELSNLKNEKELLKNKIMSNEKKISDYKNENKEIENLKNENLILKSNNEKMANHLKEILGKNEKSDKEEIIKKQNEEIDGFRQLIKKLQDQREKGDDEINSLKRENEKIKNQIIHLSKTLPEEYNELQKQYNNLETKYNQQMRNKSYNNSASGKKSKVNELENKNKIEEKLTKELKEAKNEIDIIKKKNLQLVEQLEDKEIKNNCYDNKSEDWNMSNYEEEFDLRKMAKGAREKNRSQDINIDYPGIQTIKEKYRELDFYYNSLEGLVKKLLLTIQTNPKNKTYVTELCRIVGFDLETTNKILTNKNKKLILGIFSK